MVVNCGDLVVHYETYGEGVPLILLHGNGEGGDVFKNQMASFAKQYQVYVPDTRGHGTTSWGSNVFCFDTFVEDLKNFMDALGITLANLLGFSDGGNTALMFALKYPSYVDKLILNGANLHPKGVRLKTRMGIQTERMIALCIGDKVKLKMMDLMLKEPNIQFEDLKQVEHKTLIIVGEKDVIKEKHSRAMQQAIQDAELVVVPMAGHCIVQEQPKVFNQYVEEFLGK